MPIKNFSQSLRRATVFTLMCLIFFSARVAMAWGSGGHMMVAFIAYERLNPTAKAQVDKLIAISIDPSDVTEESLDFVNASHWPDDVKNLPDFEFSGDLHFADFPFSADGTKLPGDLPKRENIIKALRDYVRILRTSTDEEEQAQALRFIIHFVGDIHQPLHCATRVDKTHLEGDRGGNDFLIKIPGANGKMRKVKLHSYWDGGLDSFPKMGPHFAPPPLSEIGPAVEIALEDNPDTNPAVRLKSPFNFKGWAFESKNLAIKFAYGGIGKGQAPSTAYKEKGVEVVRQRVAWGGYRLAALLNAIWPE
jgi:hypothetical protein